MERDVELARTLEELARLGPDEDEPNAPDQRQVGRAGFREAMRTWGGPALRNRRRTQLRGVLARLGDPAAGSDDADGCVVETSVLCGLLQEFVEGWRRTRRSRKGQWRPDDEPEAADPMSPYAWIAFDTGIPEATIRRIRNVRRYPLTELRVADALVASIGEPGMFLGDQPTLRILPNPAAPPSRRAECCGGSLTGC